MDKTKLIIFSIIGGVIIVAVLFAFGLLFGGKSDSPFNIAANLKMWGVFDNQQVYQNTFEQFKEIYPNVTISYRAFDNIEDYERTLLDALAAGKGPDIFMVRNNDLPRKVNKIFTLPNTKYSLIDLRGDFPGVVEHDFVVQGTIYALPASIDTLALFYNRNLLNEAAIVFPPKTWEEMQESIPKLTVYDVHGSITRAAIALGGSRNVNRAKDIVSLLMLQRGVKIINDEYTAATFASYEGADALAFYTQFANPHTAAFTWDSSQSDSLEAFSRGKTAMILDYSTALSDVRERSPFLEIGIAPVPQPEEAEVMSYAHYWGYTVSRQSKYLTLAWDFILSLTTNEQNAIAYTQKTERPPALLKVINRYIDDPELNVFARQALTARSWAEPDPEQVSEIFYDMIEAVIKDNTRPLNALENGENKVTRLMGKRF